MRSASDLGKQVLDEVLTSLGDDANSLTPEQRTSIEETATMLLKKEIELSAETDVSKKQSIKDQIQAIESTVQDWKVWGEFALEDAFWKGVQKVAATIGSFLAAFALEVIGRIIPVPKGDSDA